MKCQIDVQFFAAPPDLQGCFSSFYCASFAVADGKRVSDLLQPEWANLRFFEGDCPDAGVPGGDVLKRARLTATGPSSRPAHFTLGTTRMWGVGLFPLGWAKFCQGSAQALADRVVDGEHEPAFANFRDLAASLFDGKSDPKAELERIVACFRALNREVPDEERILKAHAALVDPAVASVVDFAEHSGLGRRMLEHYHDQAQFVREFRAFMGMSPGEYAALDHPILAAFMKHRAKVWGAAAQTLDPPARPAPLRQARS
jgi:hypothetical protein